MPWTFLDGMSDITFCCSNDQSPFFLLLLLCCAGCAVLDATVELFPPNRARVVLKPYNARYREESDRRICRIVTALCSVEGSGF